MEKHTFKEVTIDIMAGQSIDEAIDYAIKFHKKHNCIVNFEFNGVPIIVNKVYDEKDFLVNYFYYILCPNGRD